jgi:hypothetical protein
VAHTGKISYNIFLRANALYSFAQKPENQQQYGLLPFVNPNNPSESGASMANTYKEFTDTYTLVNALKEGWVNEDGGFAYYVEGIKQTGVKNVEGIYYDFGENGINVGQTPYTGIFLDAEFNTYRYAKLGELAYGWQLIESEWYYFNTKTGNAAVGVTKLGGVRYEFEANDNWDVIEKFAEYVGGKEDIWYATNIEIYDYIEAYNRLQWSADMTMVHNPSAISVWIKKAPHDEDSITVEIKPGETRKF